MTTAYHRFTKKCQRSVLSTAVNLLQSAASNKNHPRIRSESGENASKEQRDFGVPQNRLNSPRMVPPGTPLQSFN